ncbi:hypothetical protein D3C71_1536070 [compost metagenome]
MLDAEGLKLHDLINSLQKQDTKMTNSLKNIINKYSTDKSSVEEIVFFYKAVYTRATSFQCFNLRCWAYQINMKKADEIFEKSIEELMQYKPKGFPFKRIKKITTQIDELDIMMKRHKNDFWKKYCLPVLLRKDMNEIYKFTHSIHGDGISILKHRLYDANLYLEEKNDEEYNKILNGRVLF